MALLPIANTVGVWWSLDQTNSLVVFKTIRLLDSTCIIFCRMLYMKKWDIVLTLSVSPPAPPYTCSVLDDDMLHQNTIQPIVA